MSDCDWKGAQLREDMKLFAFYCRMMDHRLEGLHKTIERKERMA